jgi:predicted Zn-dependent protease
MGSWIRTAVWICAVIGPCLLASCNSPQSRAAAAYSEYQAAAAANDLPSARRALLKLVAARDDNSQAWLELGRVQAALGSYSDAYYAFSRARELDRSNPELLRTLTQFALSAGNLPEAQKNASDLEIVAPGDPWVPITRGFSALAEHRYQDAINASEEVLRNTPFDSVARSLKARALLGQDRRDDAIALLTSQVQAQPSDVLSLQLLAKIYRLSGSWADVERVSIALLNLKPDEEATGLAAAEASFRAGDVDAARKISLKLLGRADPQITKSVLDLWRESWGSDARVAEAFRLGRASAAEAQRLLYAQFLVDVGHPDEALALAGRASLPVSAKNVSANAVIGAALAEKGLLGPARQRLDAVLAYDGSNPIALRARCKLSLGVNPAASILDAQGLVSALPDSPEGRLLLARAYSAAGRPDEAQQALWSAFHDIPANDLIYAALSSSLRGNPQRLRSLKDEFEVQRGLQLEQGLLT